LTRWQPVPISGFLAADDYFSYLAKRQFPTVVSIRKPEQLEFCVEPDVFHDAFGHIPMHSHTIFADFLELFGRTALCAKTDEQLAQMQRLYWFTVEYGMIESEGKVKVCGSGHMSGIKEARYSLTDAVKKLPFELETVVHTDFNPHVLQDTLFVLESFDQLYDAMERKAAEFEVPKAALTQKL
jgi:phenylalanine-4-hydroxylase